MFYCASCKDVRNWPESITRSAGRCECCGVHAVCYDVPSSFLPIPVPVIPGAYQGKHRKEDKDDETREIPRQEIGNSCRRITKDQISRARYLQS